jgi:hypothetical protein
MKSNRFTNPTTRPVLRACIAAFGRPWGIATVMQIWFSE